MPQPEKINKVKALNEQLSQAKGLFLTDFSGLTVEQMTELRREFRKQDVEYIVVKNTLARMAAKDVGYEQIVPHLVGPTGLAIAKNDPIAPVRVIVDFKKKTEKPAIKGAIIEGQFLDQERAEAMKNIPTREVLLGQVVSAVASPISGLVGGLQSVITKLVYALDAVKDKKEQ